MDTMKPYLHTTQTGLRILIIPVEGSKSITTMILAGAGSRYETYDITGISHFLEHLFFKGAKKYKTPQAVSEAVDSFGGEFNAFTGKEYAGYFITSPARNFKDSCDVLSDMLINSTFLEDELARERHVIIQEMKMYEDTPAYQISWDFERLCYGDQPIGWDQIGTEEVLLSLSRQQIIDYKDELYVPQNMILVASGAVSKDDIATLEQYFTFKNTHKTRTMKPYDSHIDTKRVQIRNKKTEQMHLSIGVKGLPEPDNRFIIQQVLATILGGNMSARMFQRIREQKGLCYSIHTMIDEYTDTSLLSTTAGVDTTKSKYAIQAILDEYKDIRDNGITDIELQKAKNYMLGRIDLRRERPYNNAMYYAPQVLLYNDYRDFEALIQDIHNVSKEAIHKLSDELLAPENIHIAGIGNGITTEEVEDMIRI